MREFRHDHEIYTMGYCDLRDERAVRNLIKEYKPERVIHCAAKVGGVMANRDNPVAFMLDNLRMQNNVIEACAKAHVEKLCFVGTSCMFPRDASMPVQESSLFTGRLEDSVEAYAIAKIAGWRLCKAYHEQYGLKFVTIAPSNIYGPNDNYSDEAHVVPALIRRFHQTLATSSTIKVWGDGSAVREFIYSEDVASAVRVILDKWESPEVINVGTGLGTSIKELAELIIKTGSFGSMAKEIEWDTEKPSGIPRKTFDVSKLAGLGWKPRYSLEKGLELTWKDFRSTPRPRGMF